MFRRINNAGLVCILHADNDAPLKLWDKKLRDGKIKRMTECEIRGLILHFAGKVPYSNYLSCPANPKGQLGIRYPYMVLTLKLGDNRFFAFDVQILDDTGTRRRFRFATGAVTFEVQPFYCRVPLVLEDGWNNVIVPFHHLTKEVYNTKYVETLRIQVYPTCLLKKIYFCDRDYQEDELPKEFQFQQSVFTEHLISKKLEEAKKKASFLSTKIRASSARVGHGKKVSCDEYVAKKPSQGVKYSVREVIPRVIPINCGLGNNEGLPRRPTYSSL